MSDFAPFANDTQSWSMGEDDFTMQNGVKTISMFGEAKFGFGDADKALAAVFLGHLKTIAAQLPEGKADKALWTKKGASGLTVGGDLDVDKGETKAGALAEAIAALDKFATAAAPVKKPKAAGKPSV